MTKPSNGFFQPGSKIQSFIRQSWIGLAILLLIMTLAIVLRFYKLNEGIWLDEILTQVNYARDSYKEIVTSYDSENQNFLYSILAHTSNLILGESNWSLRLPAVLFGIGSILALYLLGLQVSNLVEALLAVALMTFSYHHVWFSQNARGYTGLLFFTLLSTWLLLRAFKEDRRHLWVWYGITAALGIYTHLTMLFVVAGQFGAYLFWIIGKKIDWGSIWRTLLLGFGIMAMLTFLLHAPVFGQMRSVIGGTEVSVVSAWKSPLWTLQELIRGLKIGFTMGVVALVALIVFVVGMLSYFRRRPDFFVIMFLPPVIGGAVTVAIGHHLWPRFFFFAIGFGVLVIIRGTVSLVNLLSKWVNLPIEKSRWLGYVSCAFIILFSAISIPSVYGPKQNYQAALEYIQNNSQPGDDVTTAGITDFVYHQYFKTTWKSIKSLDELIQIEENAGQTWAVVTFPKVLIAENPDVFQYLMDNYVQQIKFPATVGDGEIIIYVKN